MLFQFKWLYLYCFVPNGRGFKSNSPGELSRFLKIRGRVFLGHSLIIKWTWEFFSPKFTIFDTWHCKNLSQPPRDWWRRRRFMCFNMANKLAFPNPPNAIQGMNRLLYRVVATWEIVKLLIGVGPLAPLASLRQMGNNKCVNINVLSYNPLSNLWSLIPLKQTIMLTTMRPSVLSVIW